ncbi:hypothetical protein MACH10_21440 [Thalassospira tepidiphila]|uniref:ComF family protein n=1 Tax=Thalassospira tepidiphila TaxID=393657 RepID=UPI002926444E|nr:hypothetical protein MACH10_21440 [Thalassospira tepidiphila]
MTLRYHVFPHLKPEVALEVKLKEIFGNWHRGYALDKHTISSTFIGHDEYGHPQFDTLRTEVGEAVYQLKYKGKTEFIELLAEAVENHIVPLFPKIGIVIPAPASTTRYLQPVHEIAKSVAKRIGAAYFEDMVVKSPAASNTQSLKDLESKAEKEEALANRFQLNECITNEGKWNALVIDDLYHTGATSEAICKILSQYTKIDNIYMAALTWRP